jgi:murein DD-endopeptidase MepM/ murein hydrolase activator NlpD
MRQFMRRSSFLLLAVVFSVVSSIAFFGSFPQAHADNSDVQAQIDAHNQKITQLQAEIAGYQTQLNTLSGQKQTLKSALKQLELSRAKTAAQLVITQNQVAAANLRLQTLGIQITTKQQAIDLQKQALAASLRQIATTDQTPFIASVLSTDTLVSAWQSVDTHLQLNEAIQSHVGQLTSATVQLNDQKNQVTGTKKQLVTLDTNLTTQKTAIEATTASKQQLLAQTNSQESNYQKLIATKKAQERAFQNELSTLENSLKSVGASQIPHAGSGILSWPFTASFMQGCAGKQGALGNVYCITQYFGNTPFATANASIYNGMGHDGLDIGAPIGTPIAAALDGTVLATGNTDAVPGCYSFGKWVMLSHSNGLNTMYAHLSQISASKGQSVAAGDVIGYSGMTGYATGPHLHFGVYAAAGVQILTLKQFRGATTPCANATMPVSPKNGYLNPLSYL